MSKLLPQKAVIQTLAALTVVVGVLLFGPTTASAQSCINETWKAHNNKNNVTCTANDVTLSSASNIDIESGGSCDPVTGACQCFAGQNVTFTATFRMDLTADARYDVGFYLAIDDDPNGDGAISGQCVANASLAGNSVNFLNLDASPDICGDITGPLNSIGAANVDNNPLFVRARIVGAPCPDSAGSNMTLPFATTWRQPGSNQVCTGVGTGPASNDVYPGSPSKCNVGNLVLPITSVETTLSVEKDALAPGTVPETGGTMTYSVQVTNDSDIEVTLTSLTDDKYGNITTTHAAGGGFLAVTATTCVAGDNNTATCEVGGKIAANSSCSCTFTGPVPAGDAGGKFVDVVQACANNVTDPDGDCKSNDAEVTYTDVPQPPQLSKTVTNTQCVVDATYTVVVTNGSSQDKLTLHTLSDDVYGNITQVQGNIQSTTCGQASGAGVLPFEIAAGGNYTCNFVGRISSCSKTETDTVTANATDDDGQNYEKTDSASVAISVTTP